ncbi:MAG: cupin domain-containing protein [Actinomycetota bacterium]|nr:cupin domain-containing protein [Actinomycetota bacterium]
MPRVSLSDPTFTFDPADPEGFRAGLWRVGPQLGAQRTGASLYELPPGQAVCPYHYEYGEEEWALVLEGRPTLRTPEGVERLEPLDLVFFPRGPAGAHQLRNDGDGAVRVLLFSDVVVPTATAYPDSDKVGIFTGDPAEDLMTTRSTATDYFHGERGAAG